MLRAALYAMECLQLCRSTSRAHKVVNAEERGLLLSLASGRININREHCPVVGCDYQCNRLNHHMSETHSDLSVYESDTLCEALERCVALRGLAMLRASEPNTAMVSRRPLETHLPASACTMRSCHVALVRIDTPAPGLQSHGKAEEQWDEPATF